MSTPNGNQLRNGPHPSQPNTQSMPRPMSMPPTMPPPMLNVAMPNMAMPMSMTMPMPMPLPMSTDLAYYQQPQSLTLPQTFPQPQTLPQAHQAGPGVSGFPPPHPLEAPQRQGSQQQGPQKTSTPQAIGQSWISLSAIRQKLMPNDPMWLTEFTGPDLESPFDLTYQELTLGHYLTDKAASEPPRYMLHDMMEMVGPAPALGTSQYRAYLLNKYSYWIPFTKFVSKYEIRSKDEIVKLVNLVHLLTVNLMIDPTFVYQCFAYSIISCEKIDQSGLMVKRLRRMMFHLRRNQLIIMGPLSPPEQ